LLTDRRSQRVIEAAKNLAEGITTREIATQLLHQADSEDKETVLRGIDEYSVTRSTLIPHDAVTRAVPSLAASFFEQSGGSRTDEARRQSDIVRDIFGNPFRPITLDPTWLTTNVVGIVRTIYDERAFQNLPILADALEDVGCDHADILNHCRQPGEHVRGCWVVDLLLDKK